ncbi:unnamed protein product [Adineta steineri]|uniref:Uncharacterized protein n=1 Tax=Adineta steineri TaxID=433720 RepID=A0A819ZTS3_9BILA|nr:unnamed protein product [Adineta steineri]
MGYSYINRIYRQQICDHHHCTLYLFTIVACLLINATNATNNSTNADGGISGKIKNVFNSVMSSLSSQSNDNLNITANESLYDNTTSTSNTSQLSHVRAVFAIIVRLLAQGFIVVSNLKLLLSYNENKF